MHSKGQLDRREPSEGRDTVSERSSRDVVVCRVDELPVGSMKMVPVGKFGVGVYNVDGEFYGVTNYCPHEGAPICLGRVQGTTEYDPQATTFRGYRYVDDGCILRCCWHQWEFDIRTGRSVAKPERKVKVYKVRVENGEVILTR